MPQRVRKKIVCGSDNCLGQFERRHHGRDRKTAERKKEAGKHLASPGGDRQFGTAVVEHEIDDRVSQKISRRAGG